MKWVRPDRNLKHELKTLIEWKPLYLFHGLALCKFQACVRWNIFNIATYVFAGVCVVVRYSTSLWRNIVFNNVTCLVTDCLSCRNGEDCAMRSCRRRAGFPDVYSCTRPGSSAATKPRRGCWKWRGAAWGRRTGAEGSCTKRLCSSKVLGLRRELVVDPLHGNAFPVTLEHFVQFRPSSHRGWAAVRGNTQVFCIWTEKVKYTYGQGRIQPVM